MITNKQVFSILILIYLLLPLFADRPVGPEGEIRVGIFPFEPINFIDENGQAQGVYPVLTK